MQQSRTDWRTRLVLAGAAIAIFFSALEVTSPVVDFGWFNLTTSKLAAIFFFATVIVWLTGERDWRSVFNWHLLDVAVLAFLASNLLSTATAADKASAFKFSLRMAYAVGIYFGISRLPRYVRSHLVVAGAIGATLVAVTLVGLFESFIMPVTWGWLLSPFQEGVTTFGAFYNRRVAATLPFPTSLSMYLELLLPVALAFGLWLISREKRRRQRIMLIVATALVVGCAMAVQLYTYTRSGLIAAPASLLVGAVLAAVYGYGRRVLLFFTGAAAILFVIFGLSVLLSNKMDVRLGLAQQENQYGAQYTLLQMPTDMKPGEEYTARLHVKNTGHARWTTSGVDELTAAYRWVSYPDGVEQTQVPYILTPLPHDMGFGDEADIDIPFATPSDPGRYVLDFDFIQLHVAWLSAAGVPGLQVPLDFTSGTSQTFAPTEPASRFDAVAPQEEMTTRQPLWHAAILSAESHPLLGLGPDQFRFRYPDYIDVQPDDRIRTHDIFLEALANTGVVGLGVMLFLLGTAAWFQLRLVRDRTRNRDVRLLSLGLLVATIAYVGHGLFDCFLWQTGISYVFFGLLGLTVWLDRSGSKRLKAV